MCSTRFCTLAPAVAVGGFQPAGACATAGRQSTGARRRSGRLASSERVEFEVPGRPAMLAGIRARVAEFARSMPFTEDQIEDIRLAVGEAGANAIRHGAAAQPCKIRVRMEKRGGSLRVSITDRGCGFDPASVRPAAAGSLEESGRGIAIMRALVDEVGFRRMHPGTRVDLVKHVKQAQS